jgi:hypothetical protein
LFLLPEQESQAGESLREKRFGFFWGKYQKIQDHSSPHFYSYPLMPSMTGATLDDRAEMTATHRSMRFGRCSVCGEAHCLWRGFELFINKCTRVEN